MDQLIIVLVVGSFLLILWVLIGHGIWLAGSALLAVLFPTSESEAKRDADRDVIERELSRLLKSGRISMSEHERLRALFLLRDGHAMPPHFQTPQPAAAQVAHDEEVLENRTLQRHNMEGAPL